MNYLLIWDIDGTLILGRGTGRRAMEKAFLQLYGVEDGFKDIHMAGKLDSLILKEAFMQNGITERDSKRFYDLYCEFLVDEIKKTGSPLANPGIPELLGTLESSGNFYNVLGTGNIEKSARIKLSMQNINRYFPTGGFGDEETERWKVIEKAILNAARYFCMDFDRKHIYVIGDTPMDMECGKKLGTRTIGTATGMNTYEQLINCGADYVLENFKDVNAFLSIFNTAGA